MAKVGRPLKYPTPELLQKKIEEYFAFCDKNKKKYGICNLAYFLGFESRQSFFDYLEKNKFSSEDEKKQFSYILKRSKLKVESFLEENLLENKVNVIAGIFNLKNNFGYTDKHEVAHSGGVSLTISKKENEV